ncbi:MAG: GNAT family N-acetyltransferase [Defluviitaleaceae bacterium]|nr:GNAT family N-acetyltransferase [Defluviitaleaceae bacterium]
MEIKKLTPELVEEYANFFDKTPHNDSGNGEKCYCLSYCRDSVYHSGGEYWYPSEEERRLQGIKRVCDGSLQGYLAYSGEEVVGWCNANTKDACQEAMNYLRSAAGVPVDECHAGAKIKFIFCFAIAPKMRRMGVATKLLEFACKDAAADGFNFIEAPAMVDYESFPDALCWGHLTMHEKCGFSIHAEKDGKYVMQKSLRGEI